MSVSRNFIYGSVAFLFAATLALPEWGHTGFLSFLFYGMAYMTVFFHEIGHTVFSWIFGIPAIPMFDFKNGGGWSMGLTDHSVPAQIGVLCLLAGGLYTQRELFHPWAYRAIICFVAAFGVVGFTDFYLDVILFMGHGTVAILGGFMLARGIYGVFLTRPEERWLNVFAGGFFILDQIRMCDALLHDVTYQMLYETQKGGHGMGDLTRIANNHLWTQDSVAVFTMVFTIIMGVGIPAVVGWMVQQVQRSAE